MPGGSRCARDSRCVKEKGHSGWCKTTGDPPGRRTSARGGAGGSAASSRVARMQELGSRREQQVARRGGGEAADAGDWEEEDDDDGDVEYEDFGVSRAERRAARGGGAPYYREAAQAEDEEQPGEDWSGGPPAAPESYEGVRLARQRLELWQLEPFFDETVRGCVVRLGVAQAETAGLYRLAEVVGVVETPEQPYTLGSRRCTKRLQLDFGECRRTYAMTSVSNQPFDMLEMASFQQVREAARQPPISQRQVDAKVVALQRANNYQYSEEDVRRKVQQELKQQAPAKLTTRQKLLAQHGGGRQPGAHADLAAPRKFQRNVLGQAVVTDD